MSDTWNLWVIGIGLVGMVLAVCLPWPIRPKVKVLEVPASPAPIFRRPASMGPLLRPWEDIERIRVAIFADQLAAASSQSAGPDEQAVEHGSTSSEERAVAKESADSRERVIHWLMHWQEDGLLAMTGRALA